MTGGNDITKYALMIYIKLYLENIRNISYICKKTINQVGYSNGWADAVVFRPHSWVHLIACCWKNQICWVLWNKMERATFSQSCGCSIGILKGPENFFCDITSTEPKNHQFFPVQSFICAMICVICPKCFIFCLDAYQCHREKFGAKWL